MVKQVYSMQTIASVTLPETVQLPQYDRRSLRSRIVHFGFGAFHRAHQALLTDRVLNALGGDWGGDYSVRRDGSGQAHSLVRV